VAAYGIITRVMTFAYLPLLGLALALGAMVSQSHGAGRPDRSRAALRVALGASLCYVATVEAGLLLGRGVLGPGFTDDPAVAAEVARVLPFYVALYVVFGPCLILANHLQALGDAKRAALLSLARTYGFAVPLTFLLPLGLGEPGIWVAQPLADLGLLLVAGLALRRPGRIAGGPAVAVGRRGWL
jgi:Na+-driven multidrug efflux pump